jgi:hypothetical protein
LNSIYSWSNITSNRGFGSVFQWHFGDAVDAITVPPVSLSWLILTLHFAMWSRQFVAVIALVITLNSSDPVISFLAMPNMPNIKSVNHKIIAGKHANIYSNIRTVANVSSFIHLPRQDRPQRLIQLL